MSRTSNILKRVTWAPGVNLCQVVFFRVQDCPSKVGAEPRCRPKAEMTRTLQSNAPVGCLKKEHPVVPLNKWICPPNFIVCMDLPIAAGEESKEKEAQRQRESKVLEAIYPHTSAIPPSPILPSVDECQYDDRFTPIIPIIPIEEEPMKQSGKVESVGRISSGSYSAVLPQDLTRCPGKNILQFDGPAAPEQPVDQSLPLGTLTDPKADVLAAASAAFTALMKSEEHGSMVDMSLLIKILGDPKMIEKLENTRSIEAAKGLVMSESQMATPSVCIPTPDLHFTQKSATKNPDILRIARETARSINRFPEPSKVSSSLSNPCFIEPHTDTAISQKPVQHSVKNVQKYEPSFPNTNTSSTSSSYAGPPAFLPHNQVYVNASLHHKTLLGNTDNFRNHLPLSNAMPSSSFNSTFSSTSSSYLRMPAFSSQKPDFVNSIMPQSTVSEDTNNYRTQVIRIPVSNTLPSSSSKSTSLSTSSSYSYTPTFLSQKHDFVTSNMPQSTVSVGTNNFQNRAMSVSNTLPSSSSRSTCLSTSSTSLYSPGLLSQKSRSVDSSTHFKTLHPVSTSLTVLDSLNPLSVPMTSSGSHWPSPKNIENVDLKLQNSSSLRCVPEQVTLLPSVSEWTEGPKGMAIANQGLVPQKLHHGLHSSPTPIPEIVPASLTAPHGKDLNYFKNLIKKHGKETGQMTQQQFINADQTLKQKPCKYFSGPKGCRKGLSCPFQHDQSTKLQAGISREFNDSKRMKMTL